MLQDFLSPISESLVLNYLDKDQTIGGSIYKYANEFPDLETVQLAIFGVMEGRPSGRNKDAAKSPDIIRKHLYPLIKSTENIQLADLGNIKSGSSIEDTYFAVAEVSRALLADGIVPIIIGGSKELTFPQFVGFQKIKTNVEVTTVSPNIEFGAANFLQKICLFEPNILFNLNILGYQSHYVGGKVISILHKMFFEPIRLGVLRSKLNEIEPTLRNSDMFSFDVGAVKQADAPGNYNNNPNGLSSEEACQLAWYAGMSDNMRSFGLYEINPEYDYRDTTSKLGAQMIWYFIDGFYNRRGDHPDLHSEFIKYRCTMMGGNPDIIFYKSKRTDRWWMEIPDMESSRKSKSLCSVSVISG